MESIKRKLFFDSVLAVIKSLLEAGVVSLVLYFVNQVGYTQAPQVPKLPFYILWLMFLVLHTLYNLIRRGWEYRKIRKMMTKFDLSYTQATIAVITLSLNAKSQVSRSSILQRVAVEEDRIAASKESDEAYKRRRREDRRETSEKYLSRKAQT